MFLNRGIGEDLRNQSWIFIGRTDAEAESPILWPPDVKSWLRKRPWCWERLKEGGEGDDRGWDGWMASPTGWTWVWASSGSWWWTGRPGMLQSLGLQRVGHDWGTGLSWMRAVPDPCPDCWYWREATVELFLNQPQLPGSKPVLYRIVCIGILSMKNKILLLKRFRSDSCKQYYCYKEFQKLESISSGFCLITFRDIVFFSVLRWCSNMLSAWYFFLLTPLEFTSLSFSLNTICVCVLSTFLS